MEVPMARVRTIALSLVAVTTLVACNLVEEMAETKKQGDAVAIVLEKELGAKPQVGWNIMNGRLQNVNVAFPADSVATMAVGDLNARVRAAVDHGFDTPPVQVVVSTFSARGIRARAPGGQAREVGTRGFAPRALCPGAPVRRRRTRLGQ
jgi:hypothetical protein